MGAARPPGSPSSARAARSRRWPPHRCPCLSSLRSTCAGGLHQVRLEVVSAQRVGRRGSVKRVKRVNKEGQRRRGEERGAASESGSGAAEEDGDLWGHADACVYCRPIRPSAAEEPASKEEGAQEEKSRSGRKRGGSRLGRRVTAPWRAASGLASSAHSCGPAAEGGCRGPAQGDVGWRAAGEHTRAPTAAA